jgi:hypothetical protein
MAQAVKKRLAEQNLKIPEAEGLSDEDAAVLFEEWYMEWISRKRGSENGMRYAEVYWFRDEFDYLPGLKDYIAANGVKK